MEHVPDLIICDIMMPGLDGFGVLQKLRENPGTAMIPFIFLTAMAANPDCRRGMAEGADDYITKPYEVSALIGSVYRRLEKRRRQLEENRRHAEEVSLAVATAVPPEILQAVESITTVTQLVALKYADQDPQVAAMQQVVAQTCVRLRRMLRRMHLYGQLPQLYAKRFELTPAGAETPASAVIEKAAREVCRNWNREADLTMELAAASLNIGEEYLLLLVEELVDNACKFSVPGSAIAVQGAGQRGLWTLTVSSQGKGMSQDQVDRIGGFKQFWQGSQKPQGLGLGLALVQGVARLHSCEFAIQSEAAATTVNILFPLES
jgi:CheY-like chemotaxis protein